MEMGAGPGAIVNCQLGDGGSILFKIIAPNKWTKLQWKTKHPTLFRHHKLAPNSIKKKQRKYS